MTAIGIHDIELATAHHVVDLADLAEARGVDPAKFQKAGRTSSASRRPTKTW